MVLSWLRAGVLIDRFTQGLAGLEVRHALLRDGHGLAGAWVAAHARRAVGHGKTAETPDFDALSAHQSIAHGIQDGLDGQLGIALRELGKARRKFIDEIGSGHAAGLYESGRA